MWALWETLGSVEVALVRRTVEQLAKDLPTHACDSIILISLLPKL